MSGLIIKIVTIYKVCTGRGTETGDY